MNLGYLDLYLLPSFDPDKDLIGLAERRAGTIPSALKSVDRNANSFPSR